MRNLIVGTIFGIVFGAVVGATLIGPQLVEQIPGFAQQSTDTKSFAQPGFVVRQKRLDTPRLKPKPQEPKTAGAAEQWRMASAYNSSLPQLGDLPKRLERQIARLSGGQLKIQFHEPGTLVATDQMFDAVRSGTIDAGFGSPAIWASKIPALALFASTPFGPRSREFLAWFYFGDGQKIYRDIYRKQGIHSLLCGVAAPEASGWFKNKIETPNDLKGLRMRISGLGAKVMAKMGTETVSLSDGDVMVALESGALDAAEFSQPTIDLSLGLHQRANHYYFPGWHQPTTLFELLINLDAWENLDLAHQSQIATLCGDNVRFSIAQSEASQFQALKELVDQDVDIQTWPVDVVDQLRGAWREVVLEETQKNKDFKRIWASLSRFRDEYAIWSELSRP